MALTLLEDWRSTPDVARGACVALGNFDGVHLGHQAVIQAARREAQSRGADLGVIAFHPHPRRFFAPNTPPFRIQSNAARTRALEALGVNWLFLLGFDRDLSLLSDTDFVARVLCDGLGVSHVATGADFRFGKDRIGDVASLRHWGERNGFTTSVVEPVAGAGGLRCSSSEIRAALTEGDMQRAAALLTRPWAVDGVVFRGDQRGRLLGFPTANLHLGPLIRPRFGVYAVTVVIAGDARLYRGVANVGRRPTVDGQDERVEAHLFDFDGDLYGREIDVRFHHFIRTEQKFDGLDVLKAQIDTDANEARRLLDRMDEL